MIKVYATVVAVITTPIIGYLTLKYLEKCKNLNILNNSIPKSTTPKVLYNDVSSIVAALLVRIPYKFRSEVAQYTELLTDLALVYHPAIEHLITIEDLKFYITKYNSLSSRCRLKLLINNPYLKAAFYKLAFVEKHPLVTHNVNLLIECPYVDILEAYLTPETFGYLSNSQNLDVLKFLERKLRYIDWADLSANPAAVFILEKHVKNINWFSICYNKNAIHIIRNNVDKIKHSTYWSIISRNCEDITFLRENTDKLNFTDLTANRSPAAIQFMYELYQSRDQVNTQVNIAAQSITQDNITSNTVDLNTIDWNNASMDPNMIDILTDHPENIVWDKFINNSAAPVDLILLNMDKCYSHLNNAILFNTNIGNILFEVNTEKYKKLKTGMTSVISKIDIMKL